MNKYLTYFLLIFLMGFLVTQKSFAARLLSESKIQCGYEDGEDSGKIVECDILKKKCIKCLENKHSGFWAAVGSVIARAKIERYKCVDMQAPMDDDCEFAMSGGTKGDEYTSLFLGIVKAGHKEGTNCIVYNYFIKYANCYGCTVVQTLTSAFVRAAAYAYEASRQAGNKILLIGMMLWLGFFALKNVSSFATIEPMQMLQQLFTQCFKVILAMVILNSGLRTMLDYTLVPIITTGTDIADTITASVKGSFSTDNLSMDAESFKDGGGN